MHSRDIGCGAHFESCRETLIVRGGEPAGRIQRVGEHDRLRADRDDARAAILDGRACTLTYVDRDDITDLRIDDRNTA